MFETYTVPTVLLQRCSGCGRCVTACKRRCITLESVGFHKTAVIIHPDRCNQCGYCVAQCPLDALNFSLSNTSKTLV